MVLHGWPCGRVERCQVMWLDSSVGRAEDWKSSCRWFDSDRRHHKKRNSVSYISGFSSSGRAPPCQGGGSEFEPRNPLQFFWRYSQVVRHRSATPWSPVQIWVAPPSKRKALAICRCFFVCKIHIFWIHIINSLYILCNDINLRKSMGGGR